MTKRIARQRVKKRLMVKYGVEVFNHSGYTNNFSETGLFLQANQVYKPNTKLRLELHTPEGPHRLSGRVIWAKQMPPRIAGGSTAGMGLEIIEPDERWLIFCKHWIGED